jgi:hypothetical protein
MVAPWTVIALVGCSSLPDRIEFAPRPGPPECSTTHPELATPEWDKFRADAARMGKALEFDETDPTLVFAHLRLAVRTLIDREGCIVEFAAKPLAYAIKCGRLAPDAEHYRSTLETGVRDHVLEVAQDAEAYEAKCGHSPVVSPWLPAMVQVSVNGWGAMDGTVNMLGGCSLDHKDICERGCDNGNAEACSILSAYYAIKEKDPVAEVNARTRECMVRAQTKGDPKTGQACYVAIADYLKPGALRANGQKLVTMLCQAAPADGTCRMHAMMASSPFYDKARAIQIAKILDECQGPKCDGKEILALPGTPHYNAEQAHRSMEWIGVLCDADDARCGNFGPYVVNATSAFDLGIRQKFFRSQEAMCASSPTATSIGCLNMIASYMWTSPQPAKALALADRMCGEPKAPNCTFLVLCYKQGLCGVPKDLAKAREAYTRECATGMQATPTPTRESIPACGLSDGTKPLP